MLVVETVAVRTPTEATQLNTLPSSIMSAALGESFFLEIWVQSVAEVGDGVTGGQIDIGYSTARVDVKGKLDHGETFTLLTSGTANESSGYIDDFGGATLQRGIGLQPAWAKFGTVEYSVAESGSIVIDLMPGESNFSLVGYGNVNWEAVELRDLAINVTVNARDDAYIIRNDLEEENLNVLMNDLVDPNVGSGLRISDVTSPTSGGEAIVSSDGRTITYRPAVGTLGTEEFSYEVMDESGSSDVATVTITLVDPYLWQNRALPCDVNADGHVSPIDALLVINTLIWEGARRLPNPLHGGKGPPPYVDVSADLFVSPRDALIVINYLNQRVFGEGETMSRTTESLPVISTSLGAGVFNSCRDSATAQRQVESTSWQSIPELLGECTWPLLVGQPLARPAFPEPLQRCVAATSCHDLISSRCNSSTPDPLIDTFPNNLLSPPL